MTITGISGDLYFIEAPIWIDIEGLNSNTKYVKVTLTDVTNGNNTTYGSIRLHNYQNNIYDVRLDEMIKGIFNEPIHPSSVVNEMDLGINYQKVKINFLEHYDAETVGDSQTVTRTFIRGARESVSVNQTASVGLTLAETEKVLQWAGFPTYRYYIDADKKIRVQSIIEPQYIEQMKVRNECDSKYVRFKNRLGGYDFWLFESYKLDNKTKSLDVVKRRGDDLHLGLDVTRGLKLFSRIPIEKVMIAESIIASPDVAIYNPSTFKFEKMILGDNKVSYENFDSFIDLDLNLEPYTNIDRRVVV